MKRRSRFFLLYSIGFLCSVGATLLQLAFFYYTVNRWGWSAKQNLTLATIQGAIYTASALLASAISARFGRRKSLAAIYSIMTVCALLMFFTSSHAWVCCWLLVYILFTALNWPMLESLCSESTDAHELSQHIGIYNITWAVAGAVAMFGAGTLIEHFSGGLFLAPVILHGSTVLILIVLLLPRGEGEAPAEPLPRASEARQEPRPPEATIAHLDLEPGLVQSRTLALWLSRIALPAMYVVNFSLGAILPNLPVIRSLSPAMQTVYGSIWIAARMIMFMILAATVFWHTRPRLLLVSAIALLGGFLWMTVLPQPLLDPFVSLVAGQIVIGVAMGLIYTASLYFGMVLSQGSTEHGGYHEALVGVGGTLGPGAGAMAQYFWPGNLGMSVLAVGGVVGASVLAAIGASVVLRDRRNAQAMQIPRRV